MITWAMKKVFGTSHERAIRRMKPRVEAINRLEDSMKKLEDAQLRAKTAEFREKLDNGEKLDNLLVPAFAVCREASRRALKMRHYDVQLIGGMVLHEGCIAEMRTGEGKTLVATLPCYLNALEGKGVHVVTVNDYLAKRDAEWMGKIYGFLGMSVGTVVNQQNDDEKKIAYRCDITYGQNNEFGFDYLRDNMRVLGARLRAAPAALRDRRRGSTRSSSTRRARHSSSAAPPRLSSDKYRTHQRHPSPSLRQRRPLQRWTRRRSPSPSPTRGPGGRAPAQVADRASRPRTCTTRSTCRRCTS